MPFARLTLVAPLEKAESRDIGVTLTGLIADILKKRRHLTSVLVESVADANWSIDGEARAVAAHLEVCVTAGTNTAQEKKEFIRQAALLLQQAVGGLDTATYVVVRELPAGDWGYDGMTQADRAKNV
jgi:4-oxalocrotonate tautomerase